MKYLKYLVLLVGVSYLCCGGDFLLVYAQGAETATDISKEIQELLQAFLSFLSWGWVIFATIAGKLMTNDFVYGNGFHLSNFMRRVWTMMRQFANFAIGILFLYHIFKVIFSGGAVSELKDILVKIVKATILINISWFGIASMIDMSIVGVAAVGSMPAQVLNTQRDGLKSKYTVASKFIIKRDDSKKLGYDLGTGGNIKELSLNDILPQADSVTGPLFFLGVSVFQLFDKIYVPEQITSWTTMTLNTFLYLFIVLLYTIPLIILAVTNMMRIFRLWIWIMLSPIVALDWSFGLKIGDSAGEKAKKLFDPYELIALIFQPVITVAALGFALVLIIGINDIVQGGTKQGLAELSSLLQFDVSNANAGVFDNGMTFVKIAGANFGSIGLHLLLAILASILLWGIVKLSFSFSSIVAGVSDGLYKFGESALGAIPLPGTGGLGYNAAKQYAGERKDIMQGNMEKRLQGGSNDAMNQLLDKAYSAAGVDRPPSEWTTGQARDVGKAAGNIAEPTAGFVKMKEIVDDSPKTYSQVQTMVSKQILNQAHVQNWFVSGKGKPLGVTKAMFDNNTVTSHPQFQGFLDAYMKGSTLDQAVVVGASTKKALKNTSSIIYGKA